MILIQKNTEPQAWINYRRTPGVDFDAKLELKESLLAEQGYLCAYCMQRITEEGMKVEHIACRSENPDKVLEYQNLVACCKGKTGGEEHCDTSKGDKTITISPLVEHCIATLSYETKTGRIKSSDQDYNKELNDVLRLNIDILTSNRLALLKSVKDGLEKKGYSSGNIRRTLERYQNRDRDGLLKPYCGIVIYFLKKRLRQAH